MESNSFPENKNEIIITVERDNFGEGFDLLYAGHTWENAILHQIRSGSADKFVFKLWENGKVIHTVECAGNKSIIVGYIRPVVLENSVLVDLRDQSRKFITIDNSMRPSAYTLAPSRDYEMLDIERLPHKRYHRTMDAGFINPNALLDKASELGLKISPFAYKRVYETAIAHTDGEGFPTLEEAHEFILK